MLHIRQARKDEYLSVRAFYYALIDMMQSAEYKPGWEKGVYPSDEYLMESILNQTLYIGQLDGEIIAAMIVNHDCNEGYAAVPWGVDAAEEEVTVIHALGVLPSSSRKGFAKTMVKEAISLARVTGQKALRLDVLSGNLPAEKLYAGMGFQYRDTATMYYEDTGWTNFLLYEYPL